LNQGVSVNAVNEDGWTALMKAVYEGNADLVQLLIARGAAVDKQENAGWTALMMASQFGYTPIVRRLVAVAADTNIKNNTGATALMFAAINGQQYQYQRQSGQNGPDVCRRQRLSACGSNTDCVRRPHQCSRQIREYSLDPGG
jgi:hypothetical protein